MSAQDEDVVGMRAFPVDVTVQACHCARVRRFSLSCRSSLYPACHAFHALFLEAPSKWMSSTRIYLSCLHDAAVCSIGERAPFNETFGNLLCCVHLLIVFFRHSHVLFLFAKSLPSLVPTTFKPRHCCLGRERTARPETRGRYRSLSRSWQLHCFIGGLLLLDPCAPHISPDFIKFHFRLIHPALGRFLRHSVISPRFGFLSTEPAFGHVQFIPNPRPVTRRINVS